MRLDQLLYFPPGTIPPPSKEAPRGCLPCNACCSGALKIDIFDEPISPDNGGCRHATARGCEIHENRPEHPCRSFVCGWLDENSPLPDWMRPDRSNAIVLFEKTQWRGLPVDVVIPFGRKIRTKALNYLKDLAARKGRPILFAENSAQTGPLSERLEFFAWGPPAFQQEMLERQRVGLPLWDEQPPEPPKARVNA